MLISFDFWNTLYIHTGTKEFRMDVINSLVKSYFDRHQIPWNNITSNFFQLVDSFVKANHKNNNFPTEIEIGHYISKITKGQINYLHCIELKENIENLYVKQIKPDSIMGVIDFVKGSKNTHQFIITSDTYFVRGRTIRKILAQDSLLEYFNELYFSDEIKRNKTSHSKLKEFAQKHNISSKSVLHIGDLIESDSVYASNCDAQFIHYCVGGGDSSTEKSDYTFKDFVDLRDILNRYVYDSFS